MNIWPKKSIKPKKSLFYINHNWELISTSIKFPSCLVWLKTPPPRLNHASHSCTLLPSMCTCLQVYAKIHSNDNNFSPLSSRKPTSQKKRTSKLPSVEKRSCIHKSTTKILPQTPVTAPKKHPRQQCQMWKKIQLDDSEVSSNGNSLHDTLKDVYEDENETWTPSL